MEKKNVGDVAALLLNPATTIPDGVALCQRACIISAPPPLDKFSSFSNIGLQAAPKDKAAAPPIIRIFRQWRQPARSTSLLGPADCV